MHHRRGTGMRRVKQSHENKIFNWSCFQDLPQTESEKYGNEKANSLMQDASEMLKQSIGEIGFDTFVRREFNQHLTIVRGVEGASSEITFFILL